MEKDASLTVRLPDELKQALAAAAKRDGRTTSNLVERILAEWLKSQPKRR
ncbi:MAG: ribbon-helix-helix protein, CopG family [Hyphomonadaceae bacterium]